MNTHPLAALSNLTFDAPDPDTLAAGVRALVTPDCRFRLTGRAVDLDGYLEHLAGLRERVASAEMFVLDELTDRTQHPVLAAARVHVRMHLVGGGTGEGEAHLLATLDGDDRIRTFHELGRVLEPGDAHPLAD